MPKTILLALTCLLGLAACGQDTTSPLAQTPSSPPVWKMESPGSSPVAETSSTDLRALTLGQASPLTAPGWVRHTFSDGKALLYRNLDGMAAFGDVAIAPSAEMPQYIRDIETRLAQAKTPPAGPQGHLASQSLGLNPGGCSERGWWCTWSTKEYLWPNKTVYYRVPLSTTDAQGFTPDEQSKIFAQIATWNNSGSVVKWWPAADGQDAVTFHAVNTTEYCGQAYVGYQTRKRGPNTNYININRNSSYICFDEASGTVNHEMGHVVGLFHEQDRCDRNTFVNVPANTATQCGDSSLINGPFDYSSIMLYASPYVYRNFNVTPGTYVGTYSNYSNVIGRNAALTANDVNTINGIYNSPYNPY